MQYVVDEDGPNDQPNQKDLTLHGTDYANQSNGSIDVAWQWDDTDWSGANSGDACMLFDTDSDAHPNNAICLIINGSPAIVTSQVLWTCGDTGSVLNCTNPNASTTTMQTTCTLTNPSATDPFLNVGDYYPNDTRADCVVDLTDFGNPANVQLLNTCSYSSSSPTSNASDCVLVERDGFLRINKIADPDDNTQFAFRLNDGTLPGTDPVFVATGSELSPVIGVRTDQLQSLTETVPSNWDLTNASCDFSTSSLSGSTLSGIDVDPGETVTCTFNNEKQLGDLTVIKNVVNNSGGTSSASDFTLSVKQGGNDVVGSPAAGSETGTIYTLTPGTYNVSEASAAGYTASYSGDCDANGDVSIADEDDKTCTITNNDIPNSAIDITKAVAAGDEIVQVGEEVNYTLTVTTGTGTGTDPISGVSVTDPNCASAPAYQSGDTDYDTKLDPGETWSYTCSQSFATIGTKPNTATASGTDSDGNGVTDTDSKSVDVVNSDIAVDKNASDDIVQSGDSVIYSYAVTNPGTDELSGVSVSDDMCSPVDAVVSGAYNAGDTDTDGKLDPGETWQFTCTTSLTQDTINTATATGTSTSGDTQTATDQETVIVESSSIDLVKAVVAGDEIVQTGEEVNYILTVTNTGTDALSSISVTDPNCASSPAYQSGDNDLDTKLDTNETWIYTCSQTYATTGTKPNTATVSGTSTSGDQVTDTDSKSVVVESSAIHLEKSVDDSIIQSGQLVTYTLEVTNTGSDALSNVGVEDSSNDCGPISGPAKTGGDQDDLLETGETWTYTCTANPTDDVTNIAKATGLSTSGDTVEDTDGADVTVEVSVIDVEKTASESLAYTGTEVTYLFTVTNDGSDPLSDITLKDPKCSPIEAVDTDGDGDTNNPPASVDNDGDVNNNDLLDAGQDKETWQFTCKRVVNTADEDSQTGLLTNEVTATGTSTSGDQVTDVDTADVDVINPGMTVEKTADKTSVAPGTTVTYTLRATNTGDTRLFDVNVSDPQCSSAPALQSGDTGNDAYFDPGEAWVYTCSAVINQTTTNTATVTVLDPKENPIEKQASVTVTVEPPVVPVGTPAVDIPVFEQCVSRTLRVSPNYSNGAPVTGVLYIDRKKVKTVKKTNPTFKVDVTKYKAGKHRIKAVFTYSDGTVVTATGTFDKCKARVVRKKRTPKFTG